MSRKLFAFLLHELKTVRLICQSAGCGAITELSFFKLSQGGDKCPICGSAFVGAAKAGQDPVAELARAISACQGLHQLVQVEFVLPDPS